MAKIKKVKKKILKSVSATYLLPYSVGEIVSIEEKQAEVMVENKDAEFVK